MYFKRLLAVAHLSYFGYYHRLAVWVYFGVMYQLTDGRLSF